MKFGKKRIRISSSSKHRSDSKSHQINPEQTEAKENKDDEDEGEINTSTTKKQSPFKVLKGLEEKKQRPQRLKIPLAKPVV